MRLAQKLHSREEMEANRQAFLRRFAEGTVVEPLFATTCKNYQKHPRRVIISCQGCRDKNSENCIAIVP